MHVFVSVKMGKVWSQPKDRALYGEEFVVIASASDWCLKFEGVKSHGICIGIDISAQNDNIQGLDDTAAKSAMLVREAIAGNIIPHDQIHDYNLEKQPNLYTKEALRELIKNSARKVEEEGIFIFYFAGHAFLHKNEWTLAVANYNDASTGITANDLMEWIVAAECKACHILVVLDCHCAGRIGEKLISQINGNSCTRASHNQEVHVMCSCSTANVLPPVKILGGTIFSYFLSSTLRQQSSENGFNIKSSMDKIAALCCSYSTLILNYTDDLVPVQMQPSMDSSLNHKLWRPDKTANCASSKIPNDKSADEIDHSSLLDNLRDKSHRLPQLHSEVIDWLKSTEVQKSLKTLHSNALLPTPLLDGIFSALLYSVTCLHLKYDRTHIAERNLFIVAATEVILALEDSGHPKINLTKHQIKKGLDYYWLPLHLNRVQAEPIKELIIDLSLHTHT